MVFTAVKCNVTADCSSEKDKKVCKESPETGEKECAVPGDKACGDKGCPIKKFCNSENTCSDGNSFCFTYWLNI